MSTSGGIQEGGGGAVFPKFSGAGSPEGVVTGDIGNYYEDTNNGDLYNKRSGTATNTGWLGPIAYGGLSDIVAADTPTTVTCDGTPVTVGWLVAAPPQWADNAGNIILPGVYQFSAVLAKGADATSGAHLFSSLGVNGAGAATLAEIAFANSVAVANVFGLSSGAVPFAVSSVCTGEADATGTVAVQIAVARLVFNVAGAG